MYSILNDLLGDYSHEQRECTNYTKWDLRLVATLTEISGPLVGYAILAPRPHGNQAIPPDRIPPSLIPTTAPAEVIRIDFKSRRLLVGKNDLTYHDRNERIGDIKYRDGSEI